MADLLDIVQYIVLHPLFSTKTFSKKIFKNFGEQVEDFLRSQLTSDRSAKKTRSYR